MSIRFTTEDMVKKGFNFEGSKAVRVGKQTPTVKKKTASVKTGGGTKMDGKSFIEFALLAAKDNRGLLQLFQKEYQGIPGRKFRFDFAIPDKKIAIEYEGVYGGEISRHTHVTGYTNDTRKYNLGVLNGWKILRYTATNFKEVVNDLKQLLEL